ncbi:MAG: hypothetical protein AAGA48_31510 [Myxococcota bacterium]
MRVMFTWLAAFGLTGCGAHLSVSTGHVAHASAQQHHVAQHAPIHRGVVGRWARTTRGRHGHTHAFFTLGSDGRWHSGRRLRHGTVVDRRGRWFVRHGVLFLDQGHGFRRFARIHVTGSTLRLTLANHHQQVWRRH